MDQVEMEELLEEGVVFGRSRYRCHRGALMEHLWHDLPMPKAPVAPWHSIDEPEPLLESELYDRRNGHGRFWGRAQPVENMPMPFGLSNELKVPVAAAGLVLIFGILLKKDSA